MSLSEAEIQALAKIRGTEIESEPTDSQSLEGRGARSWIYLEDWNGAFANLAEKGLIITMTKLAICARDY